jgi:hypothetical protein
MNLTRPDRIGWRNEGGARIDPLTSDARLLYTSTAATLSTCASLAFKLTHTCLGSIVNAHCILWFSVAAATGCADAEPATSWQLPLHTAAPSLTVQSDDGAILTFTGARVAVRDFTFETGGELHTTSPLWRVIVPEANAHPGHFNQGTITGELAGRFVVNFADPAETGLSATLQSGDYVAASFFFDQFAADEAPDHAGACIHLTGDVTTAANTTHAVDITIVCPDDRQMQSAPFDARIRSGRGSIALSLELLDPFEGDTAFDGIDWTELATLADPGTAIRLHESSPDGPLQDAYLTVRRNLLSHDHYLFELQP